MFQCFPYFAHLCPQVVTGMPTGTNYPNVRIIISNLACFSPLHVCVCTSSLTIAPAKLPTSITPLKPTSHATLLGHYQPRLISHLKQNKPTNLATLLPWKEDLVGWLLPPQHSQGALMAAHFAFLPAQQDYFAAEPFVPPL